MSTSNFSLEPKLSNIRDLVDLQKEKILASIEAAKQARTLYLEMQKQATSKSGDASKLSIDISSRQAQVNQLKEEIRKYNVELPDDQVQTLRELTEELGTTQALMQSETALQQHFR
jgi:hypothetical protein